MKDAYSFHAGEADFKAFYQRATEAYQRIFKGLSLKTVISQADNGYMGGEYCHEFLVQHETGETYYRFGDDGTAQSCTAEAGDGVLRGIEVGNIFQLGTYYSERMRDATYVGANGIREPLYMGCYGIGIGRTLAAIAELHCDENGLVWPEAVAPYQCHLMCLGEEASERDAAERLYQELLDNGIEVLFDDRSVSAGVKFADADLIGIPKRVLVSKRTMQQSKVEYKERQDRQSKLMEFSQILERLGEQHS